MTTKRWLLVLVGTAIASVTATIFVGLALEDEALVPGALQFTMRSTVLGENREFSVHLPEEYGADTTVRYPVLYVLDGGWQFFHTAESARLLARIGQIPPLIVVGVPNISEETRNRDFTPPEMRIDTDVATSGMGAADRFLSFCTARQSSLMTMGKTMIMLVEFYRAGEGRLCGWIATPPHRRPLQGSTMAAGRDVPHDLMQFTIERALDIRDGFWGLLAHGGWFASVPGRRPTPQGRAIVRAHLAALVAVEGIVNGHYAAWKRGEATPLKPALDAMHARWLAVPDGGRLALEWPVQPLQGPVVERRAHRPGRRGRGRLHVRSAV